MHIASSQSQRPTFKSYAAWTAFADLDAAQSAMVGKRDTLRRLAARALWILCVPILSASLAPECRAQSGSLFQDPSGGAPPVGSANNSTANAGPGARMSPQTGGPGYPQQGYPQQGYPQQGYPQQGYAPTPYAGVPTSGGPAYAVNPWGNGNGMPMDGSGAPLGLQSSFMYQPPTPARVMRINDIVSIRIEEISQMIAQGNTTSRKTINFDAVLQDWIRLVGIDTIKPSVQSDGDPRARFNENEVYRGDSTMRLADQLTFNIAARIADIQPNGNLVLEARKSMTQSDNRFEASLSGICRAEDVGPNNVVLSRHIYDLRIDRQDSGHVRDGYSRGWLTRWYARVKPF